MIDQALDRSEPESDIIVPVPNTSAEEDDASTRPMKKKDKRRQKVMMDLDVDDIIFSEGRSKRSRTTVLPPTIPDSINERRPDSNNGKRGRGHRGPGKSKKSPLEFQLDKKETELSKQVPFWFTFRNLIFNLLSSYVENKTD